MPAVSWLFPDKDVRTDALCLDCAEPMIVVMRNGRILDASPETIVGHTSLPAPRWRENWAYT